MDIAKRIKARLHGVRERLLRKHAVEIGTQEQRLAAMALAHFRSHAKFKQHSGARIHVVLACHMPALWSMFDSIYKTLIEEDRTIACDRTEPLSRGDIPIGGSQQPRCAPGKAIKDAHYRRYLDYDTICEKVSRHCLTILERVESQGLAIYKNEDPFVIHIDACRAA